MAQILKFRLQDGHIYEFKYYKYSDFIDNLDPEPGVIIDVFEPFTLEDFEYAQTEYIKYIGFKRALEHLLEKIIINKKLWLQVELREQLKEKLEKLSKYDLDNPVLEWLTIKDTTEEKEIKEKLSLNSLNLLLKIGSDNIILYYLGGYDIQFKFVAACGIGHLKVAQWLYCLEVVDIHYDYERAFVIACERGHLEVAQWLYSLGGVDIHIDKEYPFRWACENGHLEVAQWLYSLGSIDIHIHCDRTFRKACGAGHLEVAQWLYSLGGVKIHIIYDEAFHWACNNGHLKMAQWLWSLGGFKKDKIETTYPHINDWISTL